MCWITYETNGETMPDEYAQYCTYDEETQLPVPEKDGINFMGWCKNSALTGTPLTEIQADGESSSITLYAMWGNVQATQEDMNDFFANQWSETNNIIIIPDSNPDLTVIKNAIKNNPSKPVGLNLGQTHITSIGSEAFKDCSGIISVTIPSSVRAIGSGAFYGCSGLTTVSIGSGVTSIGSYAFSDCSGLTTVTIPSSVTSIGSYAFYNSGLTSVTISASGISTGSSVFSESGLKSVTFTEGVTSIGEAAFYGCSGLTTVNYTGTQEEWNDIVIGSANSELTNATINYNYTPPQQ